MLNHDRIVGYIAANQGVSTDRAEEIAMASYAAGDTARLLTPGQRRRVNRKRAISAYGTNPARRRRVRERRRALAERGRAGWLWDVLWAKPAETARESV